MKKVILLGFFLAAEVLAFSLFRDARNNGKMPKNTEDKGKEEEKDKKAEKKSKRRGGISTYPNKKLTEEAGVKEEGKLEEEAEIKAKEELEEAEEEKKAETALDIKEQPEPGLITEKIVKWTVENRKIIKSKVYYCRSCNFFIRDNRKKHGDEGSKEFIFMKDYGSFIEIICTRCRRKDITLRSHTAKKVFPDYVEEITVKRIKEPSDVEAEKEIALRKEYLQRIKLNPEEWKDDTIILKNFEIRKDGEIIVTSKKVLVCPVCQHRSKKRIYKGRWFNLKGHTHKFECIKCGNDRSIGYSKNEKVIELFPNHFELREKKQEAEVQEPEEEIEEEEATEEEPIEEPEEPEVIEEPKEETQPEVQTKTIEEKPVSNFTTLDKESLREAFERKMDEEQSGNNNKGGENTGKHRSPRSGLRITFNAKR